MGLPFHGELHVDIRSGPTPGIPVVATLPDGPHARIYRAITARVRDQVRAAMNRVVPKIIIERLSVYRQASGGMSRSWVPRLALPRVQGHTKNPLYPPSRRTGGKAKNAGLLWCLRPVTDGRSP